MTFRDNVRLIREESPTATVVCIGDLTLCFSYETCVAFAIAGYGWVASENVWSKTTGKHLNQMVPRLVQRTPHELFGRMLQVVIDSVQYDKDSLIEGLNEIKEGSDD